MLHLLLEVVIVHSSLSSVATAGRDCPLVVFLVSGQHAMIDSFIEIDGLVLFFFSVTVLKILLSGFLNTLKFSSSLLCTDSLNL